MSKYTTRYYIIYFMIYLYKQNRRIEKESHPLATYCRISVETLMRFSPNSIITKSTICIGLCNILPSYRNKRKMVLWHDNYLKTGNSSHDSNALYCDPSTNDALINDLVFLRGFKCVETARTHIHIKQKHRSETKSFLSSPIKKYDRIYIPIFLTFS